MSERDLAKPLKFKAKGDYSEYIIIKEIDGEPVECVNFDALSEPQIEKYCRDHNIKRQDFPRMGVTFKA